MPTTTLINPVVQASLNALLTDSDSALTRAIPLNPIALHTLGVGSTSGNTDGVYSLDRSVTSGTPDVLDLTSIKDPIGNSITAARVIAILIVSHSTSTGQTLTHGGGTDPLYATNTQPIGPSGASLWFSPLDGSATIVGASNNNIQVTASTGTVSYTLRIFTRSA